MRNRMLSLAPAALLMLAAASLTAVPAMAQAAAGSGIKRLPDGHPDLQGVYDIATMTPLERLPGDPPSYTKEQAQKLQQDEMNRRKNDGGHIPKDPKEAKSFFALLELAGGGAVGGYDRLWLNQGTNFTVVDGQIRTSIVIEPADGHVPPFNAAAKKRRANAFGALPTSDQAEDSSKQDVSAAVSRGEYDNPEQRPLSERCLLGFGSTSGPPALPDYFYNDLHQIVQTGDNIMILTEMIHDARIVRMNAQHLPKEIRRWMGDSVGHWEGDTLVIDTTNFTDKTRFHGSTENLHVVERISRMDDNTLLYHFTVDDPQTWDRPWTGEMTWPATNKPILEYACHEGNYALGDVMRGARKQEAEQAAAKAAGKN
ncbi:MAG TPA: hypothetical protein VEF06_10465 [Bryobacteraceae bacterium]|nr:hypothetical protein [Bryobacteraceae bacterium]